MTTLRTSRTLTRLVLAWFLLTLGVAVASPIVHPQATEVICSAGGMKIVVIDGDSDSAKFGHHTLDCSLCLAVSLPPDPIHLAFEPVQVLGHALKPMVAAHIAALVGAPMPPRGPPWVT